MNSSQNKPQIIYTDSMDKDHLNKIAREVEEATGNQTPTQQVEPIRNKLPLPQFIHPVSEKLEETADLIEGLQGKPRTAKALDFLKDKLNWMKKKYGRDVSLKKK